MDKVWILSMGGEPIEAFEDEDEARFTYEYARKTACGESVELHGMPVLIKSPDVDFSRMLEGVE